MLKKEFLYFKIKIASTPILSRAKSCELDYLPFKVIDSFEIVSQRNEVEGTLRGSVMCG